MFRTAYRLPFRLLGIPVHLDITFLFILPVLAWVIGNNVELYVELLGLTVDPKSLNRGLMPFFAGLIAAIGLFLSVLIHELGHSVVARGYGVEVKRIVLWVLGGMAQFKQLPRQPGAEAVVAIAGPLTSVALGTVCGLLEHHLAGDSDLALFVFSYLFYMNMLLAGFNLLPALPLDGGRVLRSLMALKMSYLRATELSASVSKMVALLMALAGFLTYNILLLLIALFVYMAVTGETQAATISEMLRGVRVGDLMTRAVKTVSAQMRVSELVQKMLQERHLGYPVTGLDGELAGIITLENLRELGGSGQAQELAVADVMSSQIHTIREEASAWQAFQKMSRNDFQRLMVVNKEGTLIGILSKTDFMRAIQVRTVGLALDAIDGK